jgi:hypothetical protein
LKIIYPVVLITFILGFLLGTVFWFTLDTKTTEGSPGFDYSRDFTVTTSVSSNLIDFPEYVVIDSASLIANGKMTRLCDNIRVTDSRNNVLCYEIENCNSDNTIIWFKVPTTNGAELQRYKLYYGNKNAGEVQNPGCVWSNGYVSVYHGDSLLDVLGRNNLTMSGTVLFGSSNCRFGKCFQMDASSYLFDVSASGLPGGNSSSTISVWAYAPPSSVTKNIVTYGVFGSSDGANPRTRSARGIIHYTRFKVGLILAQETSNDNAGEMLFSADRIGAVNYYAATLNSTGGTLYANSDVASGLLEGPLNTYSSPIVIGSGYSIVDGYAGGLWGSSGYATIDEVRISSVERTSDWLAAEYKMSFNLGSETTL